MNMGKPLILRTTVVTAAELVGNCAKVSDVELWPLPRLKAFAQLINYWKGEKYNISQLIFLINSKKKRKKVWRLIEDESEASDNLHDNT